MSTRRPAGVRNRFAQMDMTHTEVPTSAVERAMLSEMADCKQRLAKELEGSEGNETSPTGDDPQALARLIARGYSSNGPERARLGALHRRYFELRSKLALANVGLVAHVAKRFRDRGIPVSDLVQEGFCGLLEAIDRFDLTHQTKLATYATWWIRQVMQRAVASGAYPVRLSPRHLRQLALHQQHKDRTNTARQHDPAPTGAGIVPFIHAATRPAISLDAARNSGAAFHSLQSINDLEGDSTTRLDTQEAVSHLMEVLRPREQEVLALRFGLGGRERLSLSQVGRLLEVSKERVRQIEDRALEKLKVRAENQHLDLDLSLID